MGEGRRRGIPKFRACGPEVGASELTRPNRAKGVWEGVENTPPRHMTLSVRRGVKELTDGCDPSAVAAGLGVSPKLDYLIASVLSAQTS